MAILPAVSFPLVCVPDVIPEVIPAAAAHAQVTPEPRAHQLQALSDGQQVKTETHKDPGCESLEYSLMLIRY